MTSLHTEPPVRFRDGLDVSFEDVPYPVVPAFTRRPIVHLAIECEGVCWNLGMTVRVLVRTRCGKSELAVDRRGMSWVAECERCFPKRNDVTAPPPPAPDRWEESPAEAAAADRRYWTDRDED